MVVRLPRPRRQRPVARTATYRWEEFADDALAVTQHLELAGDPRLLAAGHSKGGASLLWAAGRAPGTYPRIWGFEPIIMPAETTPAGASDNPLSAGARRRRDAVELP